MNPITLIKAAGYATTDGAWFAELASAQVRQIALIINEKQPEDMLDIAKVIVERKEQVLAALKFNDRGRPIAVKAAVRKPRKQKVVERVPHEEETEIPHVKACKV